MAKKKGHHLGVVILMGIVGWIVGVNVGGRVALASEECKRLLPPGGR